MDEPPLDDDAFDPADLDFDRQLRDRLALPPADDPPPSGRSEQVLAELRPRIGRARTVRRAQVAATILAPAALVIGGLVVLSGVTSPDDRQATVAGDPDRSSTVEDDTKRDPLHVTGTTAATGDQQPASSTVGAPVTGPAVSSPSTPSTTPPPQPTAPTTSVPATTNSPPSTGGSTSVPGSELVESSCGSIVVVVIDGDVELIETRPNGGYGVDVKSSGPEVEVSFEGPQGHCELNAEYERGELVTSSGE